MDVLIIWEKEGPQKAGLLESRQLLTNSLYLETGKMVEGSRSQAGRLLEVFGAQAWAEMHLDEAEDLRLSANLFPNIRGGKTVKGRMVFSHVS